MVSLGLILSIKVYYKSIELILFRFDNVVKERDQDFWVYQVEKSG